MRSTFRLVPYINRAKIRADDTIAVMLRITIDGTKTVMSTGIYCQPVQIIHKVTEQTDEYQKRVQKSGGK